MSWSRNKAKGPTIVVLGDINVDILARLDAAPVLGGDCLASQLELHCGGVGANTGLALAKWGIPVRLLGSTGLDWFGDYALGVLQAQGVDISFVQRAEGSLTGLILVAVSPDGQRTMVGSRGANGDLRDFAGRSSCLEGAKILHLVGYNFLTPTVAEVAQRLLEQARSRQSWVSLDVGLAASHRIPETVLQVASQVGILFAAWDEATALTGGRNRQEAFEALEGCGAGEVVVKLGEQGCVFREHGELRHAPAFPVRATDTTGAGDAFTAAFLRARLLDWPKTETALLGNAAGAAAATALGAGERMPDPEKVLQVLKAGPLPAEWEPVRRRVVERLREELPLTANASL